jgi:excisionase family DNA binding protein
MVDQALLVELVKTVNALSVTKTERLAYNITEAAQVTGIDVKQLSKAIARKELRARRIGNSWRITRAALLDWLDMP